MLVTNYVIRKKDCSKKFIDNTKYEWNLNAVLSNGEEIILAYVFSSYDINNIKIEDILFEVIRNNTGWVN